MIIVAVTEPEYQKAKAVFDAAPAFRCLPAPAAEEDLAAAIRSSGARHAIVGVETYTGSLYASLQRRSVLARFGVGHDGIDKQKATAAGIFCTNTPHTLDQSVAELAISMLLMAARRMSDLTSAMRQSAWMPQMGSELHGKKLAVIGCGPIGCRVAHIASAGFDMKVTGCSRTARATEEPWAHAGFSAITNDFAEAVAGADYISLHIPATAGNRLFLNRERLRRLPSKAWLINTARGSIVDEVELYDALAEGRLAGAALDVFAVEPYVPAAPQKDLRTLPNVILTPHVGSATSEACGRMAERALRNIAAAEERRFDALDLLNPPVLGAAAL